MATFRLKPIHTCGILIVLIIGLYYCCTIREGFAPQTNILQASDKIVTIFLFADASGINPNSIKTSDDSILSAVSTSNAITITMKDPKYSVVDYTIRGYNEIKNPNNPMKCLNPITDKNQKNKMYGWCLGEFGATASQALLFNKANAVLKMTRQKGGLSMDTSSPYKITNINKLTYDYVTLHPTGNNDSKAPNKLVNVRIDLSLKKSR